MQNAVCPQALDAALRRAKLDKMEAGHATNIVYGVLRHRAQLDHALVQLTSPKFTARTPLATVCALRIGAYEVLHMATPEYAAVNEAVALVGSATARRRFANGVLRGLIRRRDACEIIVPAEDESLSPLGALSVETCTPEWLLHKLCPPAGALASLEEVGEWARKTQQQPGLTLRINRLRATRDQVQEALQQAAQIETLEPMGLTCALLLPEGGGHVPSLPGFTAGWWSVQDVGAQCVALLAAPEPGSRVLDLCAAPGGKTTNLAELMGDMGTLVSIELHERKARLVREACDRLGLTCVHVHAADATDAEGLRRLLASRASECEPVEGERTSDDPPWLADTVVVDAPCSGSGTLRRNPEHRHRPMDDERMAALRGLQRRLLASAASCVRVGGTLTYSVCSPLLEETDDLVSAFLKARAGDFEVVRVDDPALVPYAASSEALGGERMCVRTWTHLHPADSHFAVKLRRLA